MSAFRGIGGLASKRGNVVEELYFRLESALQSGDIRAFARMGAWEALLCGTGTVWDHYYGGYELVRALQDVGLGGAVAFTMQDLDGPGKRGAEAAAAVVQALDGDHEAAAQGIVPVLGPHATDTVSEQLWRDIADMAEGWDLPIHAHCAQSVDEVQRAWDRHGCSPVQWLERIGVLGVGSRVLLVHGLYVDDADLAVLAARNVALGFCPASQAWYDFPAHLRSWRAAGVPWVLGTDAGACNDTMNIQAELRLPGLGDGFGPTWAPTHDAVRAGGGRAAAVAQHQARQDWFSGGQDTLGPAQVLASVWATPGALHSRMRCGVLQPGARADVVAWDLSHPSLWPALDPLHALVHGDAAPAIHAMWRGGRAVGQIGDFHGSLLRSEAFRAHRVEAAERLERLLGRVGLR
ncbi:MAG: amidohydrolase family protein [Alphaproteobacteria bacterium]|nr:amidohydrolase family protein [Alphaproteobacteria bacterium]